MGSFYATCSLSQMTLFNQETSIQLMVPSNYGSWDDDGTYRMSNKLNISYDKGLYVSNSVPFGLFTFFGFPINGKYDDYGLIHSVQEDKNTEILENFFNLPIEKILEVAERKADFKEIEIAKGIDIKNKKILEVLTLTYFRTDVYENLCKGYEVLSKTKQPKYSWYTNYAKIYKDLKDYYTKQNKMKSLDNLSALKMRLSFDTRLLYIDNKYNFFKLMKIDPDEFDTELRKQYKFVRTFGYDLNRQVLPSHYGTQEANLNSLKTFYEDTLKTINKDIDDNFEYFEEWDEEEEMRKERQAKLDNIFKEETLKKKKKELLKELENVDKELKEFKC